MTTDELRKALIERARRHRTREQAEVWAAEEIDTLVRWLDSGRRSVVIGSATVSSARLGTVARERVERALAEYVEELLEGLEAQQ